MGRAKGQTQASVSAGAFDAVFGTRRTTRKPQTPAERDAALFYERSGRKETWRKHEHGPLHRETGPAVIFTDSDGTGHQEFYLDGHLRCDGSGPSVIVTGDARDGTTTYYYDAQDRMHRDGGPAVTVTWPVPMERVSEESYYRHGELHRDDGPAVVKRYRDGAVTQVWYQGGTMHRDDGPAYVVIDGEGRTARSTWYQHGKQVKRPKQARETEPLPGV